VPIDRRLIDVAMLSDAERDWLDRYHAACHDKLAPLLSPQARDWLKRVTQTL